MVLVMHEQKQCAMLYQLMGWLQGWNMCHILDVVAYLKKIKKE